MVVIQFPATLPAHNQSTESEAICPTAKAWNGLSQQVNDPKHRSKSTTAWLKRKRIKVLQWSNESPNSQID